MSDARPPGGNLPLAARRERASGSDRPVRVERLVPVRAERRTWPTAATVISVVLHLLIGLPLVVGVAWPFGPAPLEQPTYATIEMIQQQTPTVGDGASSTGQGQNAEPPVPQTPPAPATAAAPAATASAAPPPQTKPPSPPLAPLTPSPDPAQAEPPSPAPPSPVEEAQGSRPSPPAQSRPDPSSDAPEIRLSDSGDPGTGIVTGAQIVPAGPDSKLHNDPPPYPAEAARYGEQGTVMLTVLVAPDGSAREVEISETSGYDRLDRAAREAVLHWHFRPAEQGGVAIESVFPVRVRFVLRS